MSMLRDPVESAINQVASEARKVADLYEDAAGRAESPRVTDLFRDLAGERSRLADRLERSLEAMGELPEDLDADAEALHRLLNAARGIFSDQDRRLLEDRERAESRLAGSIQEACDEQLPADVRAVLELTLLRIDEVRGRLRSEAAARSEEAR